MAGGIDKMLARFQLPVRSDWTNSDFVAATRVVVNFFEGGKDDIPKLNILLRKMSLAVAESRSEAEKKNKNQSKKSKKTRSIAGVQSQIDTFFKKKPAKNSIG